MNESRINLSGPTAVYPLDKSKAERVPFGRYDLLEPIGSGGIGTVHRAYHTSLKRTVALKVLHPHHATDAQFVERFRREMEAVGRVDHPNVVRALDAGEEAGGLFLVMDFVDGQTLDALLRHHKTLPYPQACALIQQAALGLDAIHRQHLVHRDLKPANLMLTRDGVVKILDLGLARLKDQDGGAELTPTRCLLGTLNYQAPEQGADPHRADIRADIYSLGCTLFKLLTGHVPYSWQGCETVEQKMLAHALAPLPPTPEQPVAVRQVLEKMTAKNPARRYQTPQQLVEALAPLAQGATLDRLFADTVPMPSDVVAETSTPGTRAQLTLPAVGDARRWPRWLVWAVLPGLGLCCALAAILAFNRERTPSDPGTAPVTQNAPTPQLPLGVRDLDQCEPLRWYDLLEREPTPLIWQEGDGLSSRLFDQNLRQFTVHAARNGIFQLATTKRTDYTYRVSINQTAWTGGAGLFLGWKQTAGGQAELQYLMFRSRPSNNLGKIVFSISRGKSDPKRSSAGKWSVPTDEYATQDIEEPFGEQCLEVKVVGGVVQRIRLNDVELKDLVQPAVNAHFKQLQSGGLGTINIVNSSVYREAKFMAHGP